jgi:hypothetical protein
MRDFRLARVTKLYPGGHAADLVFLDDRFHSPRVPIMAGVMTSTAGAFDLPQPDDVVSENSLNSTAGRVMIAIVGYYRDLPLIMGMLPPASC